MRKTDFLSSLILLLSASTLWGGTERLGLPLVRSFSEKEYRFHNQNWAITQDASGVLLVGNNYGIMEYDGQQWRTMTLANQSRVRAITCAKDGRIYVGATGVFGRLEPDAAGRNQFKTLSDRLPERYRKFEDVWDAVPVGHGVLFLSTDYLFLVKGEKIQIISAAGCSFYKVFNLRGETLVSTVGKGLMRLRQGQLEPVLEFPGLEKEKLTTMLPLQDGRTLIATRSGILRVYNPGKTIQDDSTLLAPILKAIAGQAIYHGLQLRDGRLILATLGSGIIVLDSDGHLLWKIDKTTGLLGNVVLNLFQDRTGNLWVALNQGLAMVELSTPLLYLDDRLGMDGTGLSFACMDKPLKPGDPTIYLGTHSGIFYLDPAADIVKVLPLDRQIWEPLDIRETPWGVLAVSKDGLYLIEGRHTHIIEPLANALCLAPIPGKPLDWLMGTEQGLRLISHQGATWKVKLLSGFSELIRFLFVQQDGTIWCTQEFRGLWSMRLNSDLSGIEQVRHFTRKDGLPNEQSLRVAEFQGQLRFLTNQGFYRFSEDHRRCVPDQDFNFMIKGYVGLPCLDANGRLWCMAGSAVSIITPNLHGSPKVDTTTLARLQDFTIVNNLRIFGNGLAFFTTSNGFAVYVPSASPYNPVTFATLIRSVENMRTQRIIFEGAPERLPQGEGVILPFKQNALRFNFALPSFVYQAGTIFRHHLDGLDQDWSKWDKKTEKEFNNLPFGRYKFRVQARDYQGTPGRITVFAFSIRAPWYYTWWAYILWSIGGIAALVGIIYLYTLKLRREKDHLENIVAERTQQLREAAEQLRDASLTDPLTGLRNRRFIFEVLQNDIAAFIGLKNFQLNTKNQRRSEAGDSVFGLFLFDIDFFKKVNDTYGHDAGDKILQQFAAILTGSVRQDDAVMRVGGEEFLVVLKKTIPEYIHAFTAKILKKVAATPFAIGGGTTIQKTCSIGYTIFPVYEKQPSLLTFEQSIMIADLGLFHAKSHGRNQGVCLRSGPRLPSGEEIIQKTVTSLEFALQEGFLQIDKVIAGKEFC